MMRVLLALSLAIAGVGAAMQFQGTLAGMNDDEQAGGEFQADFEDQGVKDPGHAYEDVDNDGRFTEGKDILIPDDDIRDGHHVASDPGHGLVVPRSVGTLEPGGSIHLEAGSQGHLIVQVKLEAKGPIELQAGTEARLTGLVAETDGPIDVKGPDVVHLHGATLETDDAVQVTSQAGNVNLGSSTIETPGQVTIKAGQDVNAEDARIENDQAIGLTAGRDVYVKRTTLETAGDITLTAGSNHDRIFVEGARLLDANDTAKAAPDGVEIVGTPADGQITYQG